MSTETAPKISFETITSGHYAATIEGDRRIFTVRKIDAHRRTSSAFAWTAKRGGKVGHGATREEAVRKAARA